MNAAESSIAALLFLMSVSSVSSQSASGWKSLASLPKQVGFAGMAAGVLGNRLVATGGSQWDRPIWLKGTRSFTDKIFVLDALDGRWRVATAKLPEASGHFATASTEDAVYLAGGNNLTGSLATASVIKAAGNDYALTRLSDLPAPTGYAAAAVAGGRLFVIGGVPDPSSPTPRCEVWSLDLATPKSWQREADLPGAGVIVPAAAGRGDEVYVFGGIAYSAEQKPAPSRAVYRLPRSGAAWEVLPDLPEPRVACVSPCPVLEDGRIWLIGGYADMWGGAQREHPGFSKQTLIFDPVRRAVTPGPVLPRAAESDRDASGDPGPVPMVGAPTVTWRNHVVVVGGEVRISTRTNAVLAHPLPLR